MNIFVLDLDCKTNARFHVNKHIVKMPLEAGQMLCTTLIFYGQEAIYKGTHINHPCNVWLRESLSNYYYLCELGIYLCEEYSFRYKKNHACFNVIMDCISKKPNIKDIGLTEFALAMPDECKLSDAVSSYQNYYNTHKSHLFAWKDREIPLFVNR